MGCKCFDKSISGHMQSGGGNWLIDWWMDGSWFRWTGERIARLRVLLCGWGLICRGKLLGRIWMRNVRMINEFFIKLVKVTGQVGGRGATARPVAVPPAIIVVVVALRICVFSHALNLPLSLASQRRVNVILPLTLTLATCHLPHATYRTPQRLCDLVTRSTGGGFFFASWKMKRKAERGRRQNKIKYFALPKRKNEIHKLG